MVLSAYITGMDIVVFQELHNRDLSGLLASHNLQGLKVEKIDELMRKTSNFLYFNRLCPHQKGIKMHQGLHRYFGFDAR